MIIEILITLLWLAAILTASTTLVYRVPVVRDLAWMVIKENMKRDGTL